MIIYAVNDAAVMTAWAKDQGTEGSGIKLLGDPAMELTKKLGVILDHPGPSAKGIIKRCQRFSMYVNDCKIKIFNLAAKDDDPAGDDHPEVSLAEQMIKDLDGLKEKSEL